MGISDTDCVSYITEWQDAGAVQLFGGCCWTTATTIQAVSNAPHETVPLSAHHNVPQLEPCFFFQFVLLKMELTFMSYSFALQTMCFHLNLACMFMGVEQQCARLQQLHMSCVFHAGFKFRWTWIDMVAFICSASGTRWMDRLGLQFLC